MAKRKSTMKEDKKGNRKGSYGKVKYSSRKRRSKKQDDDYFGLPEW